MSQGRNHQASFLLGIPFTHEDRDSMSSETLLDYFHTNGITYPKTVLSATVVFDLFCSHTPRCNFYSTAYPQSCWCIIQVICSV
jgi:hypothetical protein